MRMIENRSNTAATGKSKKEASNYRIRKSKLELKKKHESCDMEQEKADEVEEMDSKERAETLESKKPLLNMLNIPRKLTCQPPPRFKRKMFLEEKNMQKEVHIVTIAI